MPKKTDTPPRRLLIHVKLYAADSTEPFAIEGDEIDAGVLSSETVDYLIQSNQAEWIENN